jgi:hypothetical protein
MASDGNFAIGATEALEKYSIRGLKSSLYA